MKKLIIFNWKMRPSSLKEAERLFDSIRRKAKNLELVVAPPFVYLRELKIENCKLKIGAQNVFWANDGAYTGEISPKMLKNLGVEYVIIGHSERRKYLNETDEMINKKVLAALKAGLKVVLCVGESKQRGKGKEERGKYAKYYIKNQLQKDLQKLSSIHFSPSSLIIAYEPLWAIGTGNYCQPKDALEMIKFIKGILESKVKSQKSKVLYGGSVNSKNIESFLKYKEIDGALVGGASLKIKEVKEIVEKV